LSVVRSVGNWEEGINWEESIPMLRLAGWMTATALLGLIAWQISVDNPILPRLASVFLLALISGLAGLRLGADSAAAYIRDLTRLNKTIVAQNRELEEMNAILLNQARSHSSSDK
jgi:hypothetical protein